MGANLLYTLSCSESGLERVWAFAQYKGLNMYKSRITASLVSWVIEVPEGAMNTRFLLEFSQYATQITGTYYIY